MIASENPRVAVDLAPEHRPSPATLPGKGFATLGLLFAVLVVATRLPLAPGQLFSFDDVNFAYAIGEFDPRLSQPQPPGYPLFVVQTRLLHWLRFRRPESNLLALALIGSTAALLALAWAGSRLFDRRTGVLAACLLLVHHSFWYSGLTSALRVQLAFVSALVAGACYRAWCGERRWIYISAVLLGAGAGVRPETGVLLLPLWAAGAWSGGRRWPVRLRGLGLLALVVGTWLAPTMLASGGPLPYLRLCWSYLHDQAALTSVLFGASRRQWHETLGWTAVWGLSGALVWPVLAPLAWRAKEGFGITTARGTFLALWLLPQLAFALLVHLADPGQALGMVPVLCLITAYGILRAAARLAGWLSLEGALLVLFLPRVLMNVGIIFAAGWDETGARLRSYVAGGLNRTSLAHVRTQAWTDDQALQAVQQAAAGRRGRTVVVWEGAATSWRKVAYYFPDLAVIVLQPATTGGPPAPTVQVFRGSRLEWGARAPAPLPVSLPSGSRVVWMLGPDSALLPALSRTVPLVRMGTPYYCDLPGETGELEAGGFRLTW